MKKFIITFATLSALSTGAFASGTDHGGNGMDNNALTKASVVTESLIIKSGMIDADAYLNASQLR